MSEKFKSLSAVMLLLLREETGEKEILLQKRYNTGYGDGMWECACAGHVDENESMKQALIREAKEEIGINVNIDDVEFATLTHAYGYVTKEIYYNGFFVVKKYENIPKIMEPDKCSDLRWFYIDNLPEDILYDRRQAIQNYLNGIKYDEHDWDYVNKV